MDGHSGWEGQEALETRWVDSWDTQGADKVGFAWDILFSRHSELHRGSNGGTTQGYLMFLTFTVLVLNFTIRNTVA